MGFNVQSEQTKATQKSFTTAVNSAVESAVNNASVKCLSTNEFTVDIGSVPGYTMNGQTFPPQQCPLKVTNSTINISQVNAPVCNLNSDNISSIQNTFTNDFSNQIVQWINSNFNSEQGWLSIAFSSQSANNISRQEVATQIANNVVANIQNSCAAEIAANNRLIISICGEFDQDVINIQQKAIITNLTSCINKNTINFIASNTQLNGMAQTADNYFSSQQEGLSTIAKWIIAGVVIVVVLIIIGVLLYFVFGSKSTPPAVTPNTQKRQELLKELALKRLGEGEGSLATEATTAAEVA